ncbi:MAG: ATP synthase F1 subunit delta, F-type H+-transporting ATPase subunit delta [Candidatus Peregrinibacteria bacterium GW2011_GWC2_39_14]|nr:MAG: ATP synthase subunit delta [Candidatus Peregrinibacteria bacterium GW2011_GWA2_38_36]KKR04979.1 MAG: ATP synthase F1 subunit delta, F-type H+-transporting ATPase subunit delta [Candidatus Peregrinibacteria bacterium GW2011_GWC2_39_14]
MKTTPRNYAKALAALLKTQPVTAELVQNFVKILRKSHQEKMLNRIVNIAEQILIEENGEIKVDVISASEMTEKNIADLGKMIESATNLKPLISYKVDKGLKGGVKLRVKDYMIDASVSGKIEMMKRSFES